SGLPTPNSRLPTCTFSAWTYRPRPSAARPCTYHVDPRPASAFNDSHGNQHHWTALETVKHHLKPIRQRSVGLRQGRHAGQPHASSEVEPDSSAGGSSLRWLLSSGPDWPGLALESFGLAQRSRGVR